MEITLGALLIVLGSIIVSLVFFFAIYSFFENLQGIRNALDDISTELQELQTLKNKNAETSTEEEG